MSDFPTRRSFAILTLLSAAFVLYGSLVPFNFSRLSVDEARAAVEVFLRMDDLRVSGTDFITNVALLVPFGFFLTGALSLNRTVGALSVLITLVMGTSLAGIAESAQVFFPDRNPSMVDVFAQAVGNLVGIIGWCAAGPPLASWIRSMHQERDEGRWATRLAGLAAAGIVIAELLPVDFTIRPAELAAKYREGRIILAPHLPNPLSLPTITAWLFDALLRVPFGILAVLGWTRRDRGRDPMTAIVLGCLAVAGLELLQLFVWSRTFDSMDVLIGIVGATVGVLGASFVQRRAGASEAAPSWKAAAWLGIMFWIGCLALYHWSPFDFVADAGVARRRALQLLAVPFASYQEKSFAMAQADALVKIGLSLVLGLLLRLGSPGDPRTPSTWWTIVALAGGAIVLTGIEAGQVFLPARYPDLTDVLLGEIGIVAGFRLARVLAGRAEPVIPLARPDVPWRHFRPRERRL